MSDRIIISLLIISALCISGLSSLNAWVHPQELYVIDYWQNNGIDEHKLLILNRSRKAIQLEIRLLTVLHSPKKYIDSGKYVEDLTLAPSEFTILDYPGHEHWKRNLHFLVDGKGVGRILLETNSPGFKIPKGKIATNCKPSGTHYRNLWFILEDIVISHREKYTFRAVMECKKISGPDYLLYAQSKTQIRLRDQLEIQEYDDDVTDYKFDHLIVYPEYEYGEPCYKEFDVTIENPTYLPFVSEYYFMAISGGNTSWYQLPLLFKPKL